MSINKRNGEGYYDPTAYETLRKIQHEERQQQVKKIVFICSPLKGDMIGNMQKARDYCKFALAKNHIPLAVHLLFPQFMRDHDRAERELAISMGLQLLSKCNELWCFGMTISEGMKREIAEARRLGIMVRQFDAECSEVYYEK